MDLHPRAGLMLGLAATLLLAAGCRPPTPEPLPVAVRVKTLVPETVEHYLRFSATLLPREQVDLSFRVGGTVERLAQVDGPAGRRDVQVGDALPAGTVLAELDRQDYQRSLDEAQARLDRATADIAVAVATRDYQKVEFERFQKAGSAASATEIAKSRALLDQAQAAVAAATAAAQAARIALDQARANLEYCTLRVPFAANNTVAQRDAVAGDRFAANHVAFVIMDLSSVKVTFGVPDHMLVAPGEAAGPLKVALGQTLEVVVDALRGRTFRGQVTQIAQSADPETRTFRVEVSVPNADQTLKAGMVATVVVGGEKQAMLVPLTAIQQLRPGELSVYRVVERDGKSWAEPCRVQVGGVYDNQVELLADGSAVRVGDRVIDAGADRVVPGRPIRAYESLAQAATGGRSASAPATQP